MTKDDSNAMRFSKLEDFEKDSTIPVEQRKFIVIGGFLGAGKTTFISGFTQYLKAQKYAVGLVTNDQGQGLLDTASAQLAMGEGSKNVEEITGGCFCCRLPELVSAVEKLDAASRPDVIIAEPVGSCTDLMATVLLPLSKIYATPFQLTPLVVLLDARRVQALLGGKKKSKDFHRDVSYVYLKQLEEAEWLVVNKVDLLDMADRKDLANRLHQKFPDKKTFWISNRSKEGLEDFYQELLQATTNPQENLEVDYERYAIGEAMLGWVNSAAACTWITAAGNLEKWLLTLAKNISQKLHDEKCEVGHFKMSLEQNGIRHRVHQVMGGEEIELITESSNNQNPHIKLLINLRAEGDAIAIQSLVDAVVQAQSEMQVAFQEKAAFQPGKPQPTHRITIS